MADRVRTTKGVSLAKGPVGLVGLVALVYGVLGLLFGSSNFTAHPMNGTVLASGHFLGIYGNGWTFALIAAGGLALLIAAPLHWSAKFMSLLVGIVFGAAAVIGLINGHGVFGIFAMTHRSELVLGIAAIVLIVLAFSPRVGGRTVATDDAAVADGRTTRRGGAGGRFSRRRAAEDDAATRAEPVREEPAASGTTRE